MNKFVVGIIAGVVLGAGAVWTLQPAAHSSPAKPEEKPAEKENPLHLPPAKRDAAGITLAKPAEYTLTPEITGFGRVLDPTPLATLAAEQATAQAAAIASTKELERTRKLFAAGGNASAQAVEAAEAAAARDQAAVAAARVRMLASWGREIAGIADLRYVTEALEKGRSLLRLDVLPGDVPAAGLKVARVTLGETAMDADILGTAPVADPQLQGASFLALLRDRSLPAGLAVRAVLAGEGAPQPAFTVPRTAVVYHQGSAWIYVLGEEDTFERKLVTPGRVVGDRVVLTTGAEPDEQIVATGAQQLLAAELQAGGPPEEG
jgi:hypothetical protein